jgi:hypothetical protein
MLFSTRSSLLEEEVSSFSQEVPNAGETGTFLIGIKRFTRDFQLFHESYPGVRPGENSTNHIARYLKGWCRDKKPK